MSEGIVKRGKTYAFFVELPRDPVTGKRRKKWHSGYRTQSEARTERAKMQAAAHGGTYVPKSKQTFGEFVDEWLAAIAPTVRPSTHYSYARNLRLHVLPALGSAPLAAVDGGTLNPLYAALLADGRRDYKGGGLSPRTVRYIHTIAHRAFKDAVRWGRLARNPADAADPPKAGEASRPESITWTADQLRTFLDGTRGSRHWTAYLLLATTGLRRGEALGLRWSDLDLNAGRASIRQTVIAVKHTPMLGTPKTAKGRRTITLDAGTVAALREHRKRQAAERLLMGAGWTNNDLVFCHVDGTLLHPESASPVGSPRPCSGTDCPRSGCTTCGTAGRLWRCSLASIPRLCRNDWATPTSASRSTLTATSSAVCMRMRPSRSRSCSGRVAIR